MDLIVGITCNFGRMDWLNLVLDLPIHGQVTLQRDVVVDSCLLVVTGSSELVNPGDKLDSWHDQEPSL